VPPLTRLRFLWGDDVSDRGLAPLDHGYSWAAALRLGDYFLDSGERVML